MIINLIYEINKLKWFKINIIYIHWKYEYLKLDIQYWFINKEIIINQDKIIIWNIKNKINYYNKVFKTI